MTQDIIKEIKSEMLQEKLLYFLHTYLKQIIAVIVSIILIYSGCIYLQYRSAEKSKKYAFLYQQMFIDQEENNPEKIEAFIQQADGTIYSELATLKYAEFFEHNKQQTQAIATLLSLAAQSKHHEIANLALFHATQIMIKYNIKSPETITALSNVKDHKQPYFVLLKLMLAQIYLDNNDAKAAQDVMSHLHNLEMTPQSRNLFNIINHTIKALSL